MAKKTTSKPPSKPKESGGSKPKTYTGYGRPTKGSEGGTTPRERK